MYVSLFGLYLSFVVLIIYFSTESWWWHSSQAAENRFWGCWAAAVTAVILYSPDSPAVILQDYRSWYIDLLLCYTAFVFMRGFVRLQEQRRMGQVGSIFNKVFETTFTGDWHAEDQIFEPESRKPSTVAVRASMDISALARQLQYNIAPTAARAISNKGIIENERRILDLLRTASGEELSRIITHLNVSQLIFNVRDHFRLSDKRHKEELLQLLCVDRLDSLDPAARAALLNGMMVSDTLRTHARGAEWARHVFLNTTGTALHLMKLMLDNTGTYHSLHKLVYVDITDKSIRDEILTHIAREGEEFKRTLESDVMLSRTNETTNLLPFADLSMEARRQQAPYVKIFSDVDDTLYCSGGDGIAGLDASFPRKHIYPGVLEFYKQMEIGPDDDLGIWPEGRLGNLVFLSARPHVYKDVSERASYNLFARLQRDKGLYCTPTMLAGQANMETMASMQMAGGKLILGKFGAIRDKKFQNYSEYIALWPEYSAIFVGDNGQGDVMVAAEAIAKGFPVKAAFIHCIIPIEDTFGYEPGAEQKWSDMGIVFFKTYVGAAVEAYERGLLSLMGLQEVGESARRDLVHVLTTVPLDGKHGWPMKKRTKWVEQFNEDLAKANEYVLFEEIDEVTVEVPPPTADALAKRPSEVTISSLPSTTVATGSPPVIQISKPTEEAVKTEVLEAVKSALGRLLPRRMTSSSESSDLGSVPEEVANRAAGPSQAELAEEAVKEVIEKAEQVLADISRRSSDPQKRNSNPQLSAIDATSTIAAPAPASSSANSPAVGSSSSGGKKEQEGGQSENATAGAGGTDTSSA